jgi:RHS repeat-associated protein
MTDALGAEVWRINARPFGETVAITGTAANDNRFPGQVFDAESGLHYNYFRDYDPTLGRYLQSDPIGLRGGLNTYAYVGGNPVTRIDPYGLSDVVFDSGAETVTIIDNSGNVVGTYPAANNTTSSSNGPWLSGTYPYSHYVPHPESGATGPYGSNGNFVFDVPGRSGMGVHSGRSGPQSKTLGCIRTTDEATEHLGRVNAVDPIKTITVK